MARATLALVLGVLIAPAALPDDKAKPDAEQLQGTWKFTRLSLFGNEPPKEFLPKLRVVIEGKSFTIKPGIAFEGSNEKPDGEWKLGAKDGDSVTIELDPSKKPKTIDLTTEFDGQKATLKGIYQLDGDELKICFGQQRPKEFPTKVDSGTMLYVLKRDKK
jgi:uncharacterized protein (TIGR03067 family)